MIGEIIRRWRSGRGAGPADASYYEGLPLAPAWARKNNRAWKDDAAYVASADRYVARLVEECGLSAESRVLDIGSGQGRLVIGLLRRFPDLRRYEGVDVQESSVAWCQKHLARPNVRFRWIDVANARYNPDGSMRVDANRLPFPDASFDVVTLYSVWSHMEPGDVAAYAAEIRRLLAPGGRVFATVYAERDVPPFEDNPPGYLEELAPMGAVPLHRARFEQGYFEGLMARAGLAVERFAHRSEPETLQSAYVLRRAE